MTDICCQQEVRWRLQGAMMLVKKGRRHKLWWSGKRDRVGDMAKEELCEKVV